MRLPTPAAALRVALAAFAVVVASAAHARAAGAQGLLDLPRAGTRVRLTLERAAPDPERDGVARPTRLVTGRFERVDSSVVVVQTRDGYIEQFPHADVRAFEVSSGGRCGGRARYACFALGLAGGAAIGYGLGAFFESAARPGGDLCEPFSTDGMCDGSERQRRIQGLTMFGFAVGGGLGLVLGRERWTVIPVGALTRPLGH